MSADRARARFAELAFRPDAELDVASSALWVAAEEYPSLDVDAYTQRLDLLAREAASRLRMAASDRGRVAALNRFLFQEQRFTGNREAYDDPRNSFLSDVLDRRLGIPITLCIVYTEVARRLSLPAGGIGFPGHFLARVEASPPIIVDAFFGRVLSRAQCQDRLRLVLGPQAELVPEEHLRAATPREILVRLLSNLKHLYVRSGDYPRALGCCERILLLVPEAPGELRDRGLVYEKLECFGAAIADLERSLELAPESPHGPQVEARLAAIRRRAPRLH